MEYKTAHNTIFMLSRLLKYFALLLIVMIACNFSLGFLLWHQSGLEKTILIPSNFTKKSVVSSEGVDANYLLQCALFFVDARLDVTPETINSDNELVLSHTAPQYYAKFKSELDNEENQIKSQKVSSTFYMSNIKADPKNLMVTISGTLKRWVGERSLADSHKEYKLRFLLNGNELFLTTFQEVDKNKEA